MSVPDIHEERLENVRKQAVERLRARRAYRCPDCGYRSFQRDCSRQEITHASDRGTCSVLPPYDSSLYPVAAFRLTTRTTRFGAEPTAGGLGALVGNRGPRRGRYAFGSAGVARPSSTRAS